MDRIGISAHSDAPDLDHKSVHDEAELDDHVPSHEGEEDHFFDHKVLGYGDFVNPTHDDHISDDIDFNDFENDQVKYEAFGFDHDKKSDSFGVGKYANHYENYGKINGLDENKKLGDNYGYKYGSYDVHEKKKPSDFSGYGKGGHGESGHTGYGHDNFSGFGILSSGHDGFSLSGYGSKGYKHAGYGHGYGHGDHGDGGYGSGSFGYGDHGHRGYGNSGYSLGGYGHSDHGNCGYGQCRGRSGYGHGYGHGGYGASYEDDGNGYIYRNKGFDHNAGLKGYKTDGLGDGHGFRYSHIIVNRPVSHDGKPVHKYSSDRYVNKGGKHNYNNAKTYELSRYGQRKGNIPSHGGFIYEGGDLEYRHDDDEQHFSKHSPKGYSYKYSKVYKGKPTNKWSYNYGEYKESYSSPGRHVEHHSGGHDGSDSGKQH